MRGEMNTLDYIAQKFDLDLTQKSPIPILKINRVIMAQTLYELGFTVGAEVGVARGEHSEILCQNNPDLKLYCIDAWRGYRGYVDYLNDRLGRFYEEAKQRLAPYNCELIREFSMDAVTKFADGSLDFVYIDGGHDFKNVTNDICEWIKKVRQNGIIFGHDFKRSTNPRLVQHVVDVVQAYTYAHSINPWFTLGEKGRNDGLYREGTRSWMWVC
jgi:hypothetical protein